MQPNNKAWYYERQKSNEHRQLARNHKKKQSQRKPLTPTTQMVKNAKHTTLRGNNMFKLLLEHQANKQANKETPNDQRQY